MNAPATEAVRVSCVIPAYNAEPFVREAIASALGQTLAPCEVIVVDDGSMDRTVDIVTSLTPPVRLVRQAHAGQRVARNLGARMATGELLAFLDADDVWAPDKIRLQVELLRSNPTESAVFAHAQNFWATGVEGQGERFRDDWVARPFSALIASAMLVTRETFERVGGFDVTLNHGEVGEWLERARAAGVLLAVHPAVLVRRRIHAANSSRTAASLDDFFVLLKGKVDEKRRDPAGGAPDRTPPHE